jgi:hypothetical protein
MPRRCRPLVALLLSLLLVAMQVEAHRHVLSHHGPSAAPQQALWQAPGDASCAECALLAAGSAALVDHRQHHPAPAVADRRTDAPCVAPTTAPLSFYRSRAPPLVS